MAGEEECASRSKPKMNETATENSVCIVFLLRPVESMCTSVYVRLYIRFYLLSLYHPIDNKG